MKAKLGRFFFPCVVIGAIAVIGCCIATAGDISVRPSTDETINAISGERVDTSVIVRNSGLFPIVVTGVRTACGCTVVEFDEKADNWIPAGESRRFDVRVETSGRFGVTEFPFFLYFAYRKNPKAASVTIDIRPQAVPSPRELTLEIASGAGTSVTGEVELFSPVAHRRVEVVGVSCNDSRVSCKYISSEFVKDGFESSSAVFLGTIEVTVVGSASEFRDDARVSLRIDLAPLSQSIFVPVSIRLPKEAVHAMPTRIVVSRSTSETSRTVRIRGEVRSDAVVSVVSCPVGVTARVEKTGNGEWTVVCTISSQSAAEGRLLVSIDDLGLEIPVTVF